MPGVACKRSDEPSLPEAVPLVQRAQRDTVPARPLRPEDADLLVVSRDEGRPVRAEGDGQRRGDLVRGVERAVGAAQRAVDGPPEVERVRSAGACEDAGGRIGRGHPREPAVIIHLRKEGRDDAGTMVTAESHRQMRAWIS